MTNCQRTVGIFLMSSSSAAVSTPFLSPASSISPASTSSTSTPYFLSSPSPHQWPLGAFQVTSPQGALLPQLLQQLTWAITVRMREREE